MIGTELLIDNTPLRLGSLIGRGGEGEVYALGSDTKFVVKVYTTKDRVSREAKIAAMIRAELSKQAPLVAFPLSIARTTAGSFVGFVMRFASGHKPLHELYAPGPRKQHFPQADYRFLVRTAANIARAIASVHKSNCVIGDINHSSMLVSASALVALIDADSFQVQEGSQRFTCRVGVPEYTPPELQGIRLDTVVRTKNHDAFGLAIVIFQLLFMGRHPFVGTVRSGDIPPLHENIRKFRYAYAENRNVGMDQPPGTPAVSDFSATIAALFEQAFSRETAEQRPSAEQWIGALEDLERSLTKCDDNPLHYVHRDASECAWCEMEKELGTVLFLPDFGRGTLTAAAMDSAIANFDLSKIWAQIEAISLPTRIDLKPKPGRTSTSPSSAAISAKDSALPKKPHKFSGIVIALGAIGGIIFAPPFLIVWIILLIIGLVRANSTESGGIDGALFKDKFIDAEHRLDSGLNAWNKQIGFDALHELKSSLASAKQAYQSLSEDEQARIAKYRTERREKHLHIYLDRFSIQHAKLNGIGRAGKATLASFGIDTAADIVQSRLVSVPGFGDARLSTLLDWRRGLEKNFAYSAAENDDDRREIANIRAAIQSKAAPLRQTLINGVRNLDDAARRVRDGAARIPAQLVAAFGARDQALADLEYLGIPIPTVAVPTQTTRPSGHSNSPAPRPTGYQPPVGAPTGTSLGCPRCGSPMKKRLARRGRNAGGYFWGCSRYPVCRGTRNI